MLRIRAYFSHSYRRSDRDVNLFFWRLCVDAGITLVVDPKAQVLSVTRLEKLIQRTQAAIGVIPLRADEPKFLCSPYAILEYGLAVQARTPLVAFVEDGVVGRPFPSNRDGVVSFNRQRLEDSEGDAREALDRLKNAAAGREQSLGGQLGTVALLRSEKSKRAFPDRTIARIREVVRRAGFEFAIDTLDFELPHVFAMRLDSYDAVLVDVSTDAPDRWILPYVYARFVPSVRLYRLKEPGGVPKSADFLDILAAQVQLERSSTDEIVVFWRDAEDIATKLETQLLRLRQQHTELHPEPDGERYLRSLGRSMGDAQVFLSNSGADDQFAEDLSRSLYLANIQHFHYRAANDIPVGSVWEAQLRERVKRSQVLVALVSRDYAASAWCMEELHLAQANPDTIVVPYYLDPSVNIDGLKQQGRVLGLDPKENIKRIVADLESVLEERQAMSTMPAIETIDIDRERDDLPADILIMTIKPEEYDAVLASLDAHRRIEATRARPNFYSWHLGIVKRATGNAKFRVVVGLVGQQGELPASQAIRTSVDTWRPTLCLMVGIAGGIPARKVRLGDVALSTEIWHYDFGAVDDTFDPSIRRIYQVNDPVLTAAMTLDASYPTWSESIRPRAPGPTDSRIHAGVIASGDKVVQRSDSPSFAPALAKEKKIIAVEMEGAGAAAAIHSAQQQSVGSDTTGVGFLMIRGISDLLRTQEDIAAEPQHEERKSWTEYASLVAAQFSVELIRRRWPFAPREHMTQPSPGQDT